MKSKQNDAELIAEAYAKVEVQEEMLGALAGGIGAAARGAAKGAAAVAKSPVTKKVIKGAGKAIKKGAETVGGAALGAIGGAAEGAAKAVGGVVQGAVEGTVGAVQGAVDGATGGIGKAAKGAVGMEDGEHEEKEMAPIAGMKNVTKRKLSGDELQAKVHKSIAKGDIDSSDGASIMHMHNRTSEDAEHAAPIEVDMSENPAPESLEVTKEPDHEPCAIEAPSIQPSVEAERINHHDDSEVKMALAELYKIEKYAFALGLMMKETKALEGWTAAKITKAADYLGSVFHKLDYDFHAEAEDHADITPEDHESH